MIYEVFIIDTVIQFFTSRKAPLKNSEFENNKNFEILMESKVENRTRKLESRK